MINKGDLVLRWLEYNELILHMPILKEFLRNTFCHPHWESESICNLSWDKKYWINLIRFLRNLSSLVENNSKYFFFPFLENVLPIASLNSCLFTPNGYIFKRKNISHLHNFVFVFIYYKGTKGGCQIWKIV